jgi:hypothetical protein
MRTGIPVVPDSTYAKAVEASQDGDGDQGPGLLGGTPEGQGRERKQGRGEREWK